MLLGKACRKKVQIEKDGNAWEKVKSKIFLFDNLIFTQLCDIVMGTKRLQPWLPYKLKYYVHSSKYTSYVMAVATSFEVVRLIYRCVL